MQANNLTTFTYPTTPYFTDVPPSHPFFRFIQKVRELGIPKRLQRDAILRNHRRHAGGGGADDPARDPRGAVGCFRHTPKTSIRYRGKSIDKIASF